MKRCLSLLILLAFVLDGCRAPPKELLQIRLNLFREPVSFDGAPTLDPALASDTAVRVDELLFLGLTDFGEGMEVIPELATKWTVSDDGLTWTFRMRQNAFWVRYNHTTRGVEKIRPVTAHDVAYGIKRSLSVEAGFNYSYVLYDIKGAEEFHSRKNINPTSVGIEVLDDYTIRFTLKKPASYFPAIAGLWVARPQPREAIELYGEEWTEAGRIWTNGPYVLSSWEHGQRMVLEKNPYYYDAGEVSIARVYWVMVEDISRAVAMYEQEELDEVAVPLEELERIEAHPVLAKELHLVPVVCSSFLGFNTTKPPFDSSLVRKSFSAALDRRRLIGEVRGTWGVPARTLVPPGVFGNIDPEVAQEKNIGIDYDPAQAETWLADAGYPKGQGLPEITLMYATGLREENVRLIQQMWEETLGVRVTLVSTQTLSAALHENPPQVWLQSQCAAYPDANSLLNDVFHSRSPRNYTRWRNEEFDCLVEEAAREVNPARRKELYRQAEEILCGEEAAIAPLYFFTMLILTKPWVKRTDSPYGIDHIERWKLTEAPPRPQVGLPASTPWALSPVPSPTLTGYLTPTPLSTLTPFATPTAFPTPTFLPTLFPLLLLPLPTELSRDASWAAMRRGQESDVLTMGELPRYRLGLQVDFRQGLLGGREELLFTNHEGETLEEIVLRLYPNFRLAEEGIAYEDRMRAGGATVNGEPVEMRYIASNTAVAIRLPYPLPPEATIRLELDFTVSLDPAGKEHWALASFYPLLAVYDEAGWRTDIAPTGDLVYSESALYIAKLTLPGDMGFAASGTEVAADSNPDGTVTHTLVGPGLRDLALAFGEMLQQAQVHVEGCTIHLWHFPDDPLVEAKLRAVADAMHVFDRRFGPYPYADLDVVTQFDPQWRGAAGAGMEYPGLIFYTHGDKNWEYTLVHEVAHQWWFSMVGNDVHLEPWLDEALAEYSAFIYFQEVHGEEEARKAFQVNVLEEYEMGLEAGRISGKEPVGQSVYDFPPQHAMYRWTVYSRGALFLDALRREMGNEAFFKFLNEYCQ